MVGVHKRSAVARTPSLAQVRSGSCYPRRKWTDCRQRSSSHNDCNPLQLPCQLVISDGGLHYEMSDYLTLSQQTSQVRKYLTSHHQILAMPLDARTQPLEVQLVSRFMGGGSCSAPPYDCRDCEWHGVDGLSTGQLQPETQAIAQIRGM